MDADIIVTIVIAFISSAGLFTFLEFLIKRKDSKKNVNSEIETTLKEMAEKLDKLEKDGCRTQLLLMMSDHPDNITEIMTLAEHYFGELRGNWYMSSMFAAWLDAHNIARPLWLAEHRDN